MLLFNTDNLLRFTKLEKCLPEFLVFFTVFLKNRNICSKIKRSKVADYAALSTAKKYMKDPVRIYFGPLKNHVKY